MTAFKAILMWELRSGLRRPSTWVYFGIFLALAFVGTLLAADAWDIGPGGGNDLANSPHAIAGSLTGLVLLGLIVTASISGAALHSDYEAGIDPLVYTTPLTKGQFLGGRFTGALALNLIVFASVGLGTALAAASPWAKPEKVGPFDPAAYVSAYLSFAIPNIVLTSAIFFAIVSVTRRMLPVFVGGVVLLIGYSVAGVLLADIESKRLAALVDPFGIRALSLTTQYWSIVEKNFLHIPFEGIILANRVIWLSVALAIFAAAYRRFRFAHPAEGDRILTLPVSEMDMRALELPHASQRFDVAARLTQFAAVFRQSFWRLVRNRYFAILLGVGLFFLGVAAREAGRIFGTPTWPVTYHMEEILVGTIGTFMIILTAIYSGELVWADRDSKSHQIADATPVTTSVVFLAKLAALCAVIAVILVVMMLAGIVTQTLKGYYNFEIPLYVQALFGIRYPDMVLLAVFAMTVHTLANHKYVGHLLVIVLLIGLGLLPALGFERGLYQYSYDSGTTYSDMNGWGPFLVPFVWWKLYWLSFCVLLLVLANLFWVRGEETRLSLRVRLARERFGRQTRMVTGSAALAVVGLGGFLYYNTDHLNIFRTGPQDRKLRAEREKRYKKFEYAPQPRIVAVSVRLDLEPRRQAMRVAGQYVLRNKTTLPIDTIHIGLSEEVEILALTFDGAGRRVLADSTRDYHMYRLARSLAPGDSTVMRFELAHRKRGIPNRVGNTYLVENGSFLSSASFLPTIGYNHQMELSDDDARRKEKLPPKERMRPPSDPATRATNYVSHDADWMRFEAIVSTDDDQIALAPGYLRREWVENGRRVFHYTMDTPILNFWAVLSARYAVRRDTWRDTSRGGNPAQNVDIALYYHPTHTYNLDRMVAGVKRALDYYTEHFGPYQHRQVRIVEFPRYAPFAQSLPNLIPYSEAVGFIARVRGPDDVDYPFYITAHEVAHAWWAHQVIGADAQGATMLSETLSQYAALMVMEKEYGPINMRKYLAYELDSYLMNRGAEQRREMPLKLVENQPYIHYNKGSLVMYALRDYIGEGRVNLTLRRFLEANKYKGPPYPTSLELVDALRAATPDSLKYLITDLFDTITLYELRTDSAIVTDAAGQPGRFQVDLWVNARKLRADSLGKQTDIGMRDWIDLGVYAEPPDSVEVQDKNGIPLHLAKQRVDSGPQRFTIVVDRRPWRAGIDPLHKLTDRFSPNNTVKVKDRSAPAPNPRGGAGVQEKQP